MGYAFVAWFGIIAWVIIFLIMLKDAKQKPKEIQEPKLPPDADLPEVTEFEQIEDEEARKKVIALVEDWEAWDICIMGDAIGSAGWRCKKFKNCRACLTDYAFYNQDCPLIEDNLELVNPMELVDLNSIIVEKLEH